MPEEITKRVRAKFTCQSITKRKDWNTYPQNSDHPYLWDYEFSPVTSGSEENKQFYAYTPSGSIKLSSISAELFEVGKDYYLDFTPA